MDSKNLKVLNLRNTLYWQLCLMFKIEFQKLSKGLLDGPEIRQSICLIVRPIKLTLSLTTPTQSVQCILSHMYMGARSAPPITPLQNTQPVKLSVSLIGLTIKQTFA